MKPTILFKVEAAVVLVGWLIDHPVIVGHLGIGRGIYLETDERHHNVSVYAISV